jgi:hypothetical protein
MRRARACHCRRTRRSPAPSRPSVRSWPYQYWGGCTTNMSGREFPPGTGRISAKFRFMTRRLRRGVTRTFVKRCYRCISCTYFHNGRRIIPASKLALPPRNCRGCTSPCPDYCRRNTIFHRRARVRQIAILTIQLVGHIAACSADPAVIKAADEQLLAICERDNLCPVVNPEAKILFGAR